MLAAALSLLTACAAMGATRYAAPGGTGADPCADPTSPCSLYTAADSGAPGTTIGSGDVVELAPGAYSEAAGDLGANDYVNVNGGVTVRGEPGATRPLIRLEEGAGFWGAFSVGGGARIVGLNVVVEAGGSAINVTQGGTVERVVARSTGSSSITCSIAEGTLRDSACLHEGGGIALGTAVLTFVGTHSVTLRNVTAIGTGPGSVGMSFSYFGSAPGVIGDVKGKAVIASGAAKDVVARGMSNNGTPGNGATTSIALDHSSYADVGTETSGGGTASITTPGNNDNITAEAALAADGYHQLPASPTVDKGAMDASSGSMDVDGQWRAIGLEPDIGADELASATSTSIVCPPTATFSSPVSETVFCTATVTDTAPSPTTPGGRVTFFATGGIISGDCLLIASSVNSSNCLMNYSPIPNSLGSHAVVATYKGDSSHEGSQGSTSITVIEKTAPGGGGSSIPPPPPNPPPTTQLKKHPAKRTTKQPAKFTFSSNEPGSRFECMLDKKAFRACSSPYRKKVKLGKHVFQVRAVDAQGKADPSPAIFRWQVVRP